MGNASIERLSVGVAQEVFRAACNSMPLLSQRDTDTFPGNAQTVAWDECRKVSGLPASKQPFRFSSPDYSGWLALIFSTASEVINNASDKSFKHKFHVGSQKTSPSKNAEAAKIEKATQISISVF